jgi:hypothetical protein
MFDGLARGGDFMRLDTAMVFLLGARCVRKIGRRRGERSLSCCCFQARADCLSPGIGDGGFGSHGGANGDSRSRFLVVAIELCGLWLKYNRNSIDLG